MQTLPVFLHSWFRLISILSMSKDPTFSNIPKGQGTADPHPRPKKRQRLWSGKWPGHAFPNGTCLLETPPLLCPAVYLCYLFSGLGITAGAHRLWSHRTYKAWLPLRVFLVIANTMASR
jgi:hypothetical protein